MSVNIQTFGCRLNAYESELIRRASGDANLSNTTIFNSCAVTQEAERQLKQAIRRERRLYPERRIIVTGCAAQINPEEYANMKEVDQVLGNKEKVLPDSYKVLDIQHRVLVNDIMSIKEETHYMPIDIMHNRTRSFLQVQTGCNHRCTYCIIPYGRGNSRSIPLGEIVKQAQILVDAGYQELVLTGVDITDYGLDLPGQPSFGMTVKRLLAQVPNLKRLRLSSLDVAEIDEHLFDLLAYQTRVMPHIHLSLQSGDDLILKRMKRRHRRAEVIEFCNKIKRIRPQITFGADVIAGFPTETEEMFLSTVDIITAAHLTYIHVFPYSRRPGTPAAKMPQVSGNVIKERAMRLRLLAEKQLANHNQSLIGTRTNIIAESKQYGRAEDFSLIKLDKMLDEGTLASVMIKDASGKDLFGKVLSS